MAKRESPVHLGAMRDRNLALVLGEIARHGAVTRARLAELTGLTKTTVSAQVAVLERLRLVEGRSRSAAAAADAPARRCRWPGSRWRAWGWRSTATIWRPVCWT
ncbi:MarR family transcriptional regulator [Yinghuangia aomiensis]